MALKSRNSWKPFLHKKRRAGWHALNIYNFRLQRLAEQPHIHLWKQLGISLGRLAEAISVIRFEGQMAKQDMLWLELLQQKCSAF